MVANTLTPTRQGVRQSSQSEDGDVLAERHLLHRIVIGIAILIPVGAAFFTGLVAVAVVSTGSAMTGPLAMGAGIGALAGLFFGTWVGFVASVNEFEDLEHR